MHSSSAYSFSHFYMLTTYNTQLAMVTYTSPKDTDDPLADNETQDDNEAGSCHKSQSLSSQGGGGDIADDLHSYLRPHTTQAMPAD